MLYKRLCHANKVVSAPQRLRGWRVEVGLPTLLCHVSGGRGPHRRIDKSEGETVGENP